MSTTYGSDLVREARKRSGLSRRELARKAGVADRAVDDLESGDIQLSFDEVLRWVRLCGFDLDIMMSPRDSSDWCHARRYLQHPVAERAEHRVEFGRWLRWVRLCGFDLDIMMSPRDSSDWCHARRYLQHPVAERAEHRVEFGRWLRRLQLPHARFEWPDLYPGPILSVLRQHQVRYVVIGGIASSAGLWTSASCPCSARSSPTATSK
ncbi:MAG TPA: helix-turn-helix domain-containing protein [Nocardioides sp.]|nr:helix-turn-helix domain-containing protein [Nocardioides sp.]